MTSTTQPPPKPPQCQHYHDGLRCMSYATCVLAVHSTPNKPYYMYSCSVCAHYGLRVHNIATVEPL